MKNNINNNSVINENASLNNCELGTGIRIYNAEVQNTKLGNKCTIGDLAIVNKSFMESCVSINRRNFIFNSKIGHYTYTGINTMIFSALVGRFCSISWNVSIGGNDHPHGNITTSTMSRFYQLDQSESSQEKRDHLKDTINNLKICEIGNDVLVSSNAVILRNIRVGHGAIIGAGAVVTKDIEPYTIVAGVPAKPLRKRFPEHIIDALLDICWWDWPVETIKENINLIYKTKVDDDVVKRLNIISKKIKNAR